MPSKIGLYKKYNVSRVDGRDDGPDAEYIVLRVDDGAKNRDAALAGVRAFAVAIEDDNPELASELRCLLEYGLSGFHDHALRDMGF